MPSHVLVYDHSATILAKFHHALYQEGFRVTARFPREIEPALVAKHMPEVILLALSPDTYHGSIERMLRVHDDPTLVHIPVIFCIPEGASIPTPEDVEGFHRVSYVPDPFNIDAAIAMIRALEPSNSA